MPYIRPTSDQVIAEAAPVAAPPRVYQATEMRASNAPDFYRAYAPRFTMSSKLSGDEIKCLRRWGDEPFSFEVA